MTDRRTLLVRLAAGVAATSGLIFGTGAFTRTGADRDFALQVTPDSDSLLSLEPSGVDSAVVSTTDDDRDLLEFNSDQLGLNTNTTGTIGRFGSVDFDEPDTLDEEAFVIGNNTEAEIEVTIEIEEVGAADIKFVLSDEDPSDPETQVDIGGSGTVTITDTDTEPSPIEVDSSEQLHGGVIIRTDEATEIESEISISAERTGGGE